MWSATDTGVTLSESWNVKGWFFDICSCNVSCPCWFGVSPPTKNGICEFLNAFTIAEGSYGDVRMTELKAVLVGVMPGHINSGNWTLALYFDDKANEAQRKALGAIFSGQAGGPPKALGQFIGKVLGVKFVPIEFVRDGPNFKLSIAGIASAEFQPVEGADKKEIKIANTPWGGNFGAVEPVSVGRTSVHAYNDKEYIWSWENAGKAVTYAPFAWKGP